MTVKMGMRPKDVFIKYALSWDGYRYQVVRTINCPIGSR